MIKAKFNGSVGSKTPTVDCQRNGTPEGVENTESLEVGLAPWMR